MKHTIMLSAVVTLFLAIHAQTSHAQPAWRCDGDDCQDDLLNDIEDLVNANWTPYSITMPPIPISCVTRPDRCPRCVVKEPALGAANTEPVSSAISRWTYPWTFVFWRTWQSFLFGRYSAAMTVSGSAETFGPNVDYASWPSTAIHFSFVPPPPPPRQVTTPAGENTGVTDLDAMSATIMSGGLWTGNLGLPLNMTEWASCDVGYPGATIRIDGAVTGRRVITVNYPVGWTPLVGLLAEAVRNQFRSAVVTAISN
jgi:hypothetical protein